MNVSGSIQGEPAGQNRSRAAFSSPQWSSVGVLAVGRDDRAIDLDGADGPGELVVSRVECRGLAVDLEFDLCRSHGAADRVGGHVDRDEAELDGAAAADLDVGGLAEVEVEGAEERKASGIRGILGSQRGGKRASTARHPQASIDCPRLTLPSVTGIANLLADLHLEPSGPGSASLAAEPKATPQMRKPRHSRGVAFSSATATQIREARARRGSAKTHGIRSGPARSSTRLPQRLVVLHPHQRARRQERLQLPRARTGKG